MSKGQAPSPTASKPKPPQKEDPIKTTLLDKLKAQRKQLVTEFLELSQQMTDGPIEKRPTFTDPTCLLFLLIFVGCFFAIGGYQIAKYKNTSFESQANINPLYIENGIGSLFVGITISLVLSYAYILLFTFFPAVMLYLMIVFSECGLLAGAIVGISLGITWLFVVMLVLVIVYAILVFCFFQSLKTGMAMIALTSKFIKDNIVAITIMPIIFLFFSIGMSIFHTYGLASTYSVLIYNHDNGISYTRQGFFIFVFIVMWFFFVFWIYYLMTYSISFLYSMWYYQKVMTGEKLSQGIGWMLRQMGSYVFASITLVIFSIGRLLSYSEPKNPQGAAASTCEKIVVTCLTKKLEQSIQYLNHYSVIMSQLTGKEYVVCAQLAYGLLSQYSKLKYYTSTTSKFLNIWGLIFTVLVPVAIGAETVLNQILMVVTLGVNCWVISSMVFQILVESMSCSLVFVALDDLRMGKGNGKIGEEEDFGDKGKDKDKDKKKVQEQGETKGEGGDVDVGLEVLNKRKGYMVKTLMEELDKYSNTQNKQKIQKELKSSKETQLQDMKNKDNSDKKSTGEEQKKRKSNASKSAKSSSSGKDSDNEESQKPIKAGDLIKAQLTDFVQQAREFNEKIDDYIDNQDGKL